MNSVDTVVKNAMLGSPSIFPNRLSVLSFIFLNAGGGYHWNNAGQADCIYGMPEPTATMRMEDLDERMADAKERAHEDEPEHMNFQLAETKLHKMQRQHIADHIDLYATHQDVFAKMKLSDLTMLTLSSELHGTLLGDIDQPKTLDKEWAMAASEVAHVALKAVREAKKDGELPQHMDKMEGALTKALDTLEPITHARENAAKAALAFKDIWDSLGMDKALGL